MPRPRTKWFIIITAADGATEMFGPWLDSDKASDIADKCRDFSSRYTGNSDQADFEVDLIKAEAVQRQANLIERLEAAGLSHRQAQALAVILHAVDQRVEKDEDPRSFWHNPVESGVTIMERAWEDTKR